MSAGEPAAAAPAAAAPATETAYRCRYCGGDHRDKRDMRIAQLEAELAGLQKRLAEKDGLLAAAVETRDELGEKYVHARELVDTLGELLRARHAACARDGIDCDLCLALQRAEEVLSCD